ncbi:hypothetical protein LSAT2_021579 [Lamellibrachia satsuma]|nr:hypothetical protein LSAT2_021579 [Lamellibrachia satsuma]
MVFVTFRSIDMKTVYVAQTTSQLLSCTEERLFWISWHNGQVAVGGGRKMGRNIVMAYEEMNPFRLTALSVTTDGSNGTWRFPVSQVKQDTATSMPPVTAKTTPSAPLAGSASGGLSSAQIAGMVIGFLGLVVLLVVVIACVKRYKGSIGLVNLEELRDTTSVTSSQGYTNTNTTSNM